MVEMSAKGNMTKYKLVHGCPCDEGQDVDGGYSKHEVNKRIKAQEENPSKPCEYYGNGLMIMCVDKVVWKDWDIYDEDIVWSHPLAKAPCPIHDPLSFSVWKMKKKLKEMN